MAHDGRRLSGTRHALVVSGEGHELHRWPWLQVAGASWSAGESALVVRVQDWTGASCDAGAVDHHRFVLDDAARLLDLVRERVQASVLLRRTVAVESGGEAVVALRRGSTDGAGRGEEFRWAVDLSLGQELTSRDRDALEFTAAGMAEELGLAGAVAPLWLR